MTDAPKDPNVAAAEAGAARLRIAMPILTTRQAKTLFSAAVACAAEAREQALEELVAWHDVQAQRRRFEEAQERAFMGEKPLKAAAPHVILGILPNASEETIRAAWRGLARRAHPDVPGGDHVTMAAINAARDAMLGSNGVRP